MGFPPGRDADCGVAIKKNRIIGMLAQLRKHRSEKG